MRSDAERFRDTLEAIERIERYIDVEAVKAVIERDLPVLKPPKPF